MSHITFLETNLRAVNTRISVLTTHAYDTIRNDPKTHEEVKTLEIIADSLQKEIDKYVELGN